MTQEERDIKLIQHGMKLATGVIACIWAKTLRYGPPSYTTLVKSIDNTSSLLVASDIPKLETSEQQPEQHLLVIQDDNEESFCFLKPNIAEAHAHRDKIRARMELVKMKCKIYSLTEVS